MWAEQVDWESCFCVWDNFWVIPTTRNAWLSTIFCLYHNEYGKNYLMDVLAQAAAILTTLWDTLGSNLSQGNDWPQLRFPFVSLVRPMKRQGSFLSRLSLLNHSMTIHSLTHSHRQKSYPCLRRKGIQRNTCVAPLILNFGTRWRRISFTPHPPYPKEPWSTGGWVYPRGDLSVVEKERDLVPDGNQTPYHPTRTSANIPTSLFWFTYTVSIANSAVK